MRGFISNLESEGPKDLLLGTTNSDLMDIKSHGTKPVPAFQALLDNKLMRLRELTSTPYEALVGDIEYSLFNSNISNMKHQAIELAFLADGDLATVAAELAALL